MEGAPAREGREGEDHEAVEAGRRWQERGDQVGASHEHQVMSIRDNLYRKRFDYNVKAQEAAGRGGGLDKKLLAME
jgi:hypothetical protein